MTARYLASLTAGRIIECHLLPSLHGEGFAVTFVEARPASEPRVWHGSDGSQGAVAIPGEVLETVTEHFTDYVRALARWDALAARARET